MRDASYNLGVNPIHAKVWSAGIAFVIIPSDVDRAEYIAECFRTSTVSIFSEHNGYSNRVQIDLFSLNFVNFPTETNEFGSAVAFTIEPVSKRPFITGIFFKDDQISQLKEHQFRFRRELDGNIVELMGSPQDGFLGFNVKAVNGGEVAISVESDDDSGKLNVTIDGDINLQALGNTTIKQFNKLSIVTVDRDNENELSIFEQNSTQHEFFDKEHKVNTQKFSINNGQEPLILGKVWKKFMDDCIDEIGKSTVLTPLGQMPLLNKAQIIAFKEKTSSMLSEIGFINK
ncbi:MAG: hypothetical protein H7Y42_13960 [Chitinophagaceae bacterium]|nr:hypothetical protein [Chitinophagaceae bacterium]